MTNIDFDLLIHFLFIFHDERCLFGASLVRRFVGLGRDLGRLLELFVEDFRMVALRLILKLAISQILGDKLAMHLGRQSGFQDQFLLFNAEKGLGL